MTIISGKKDAKAQKMGARANDLSLYAQAIWQESDLSKKKLLAHEMANHFEVGGKQDFIDSVNVISSTKQLDQLVANTMLKGEGKSTKRF